MRLTPRGRSNRIEAVGRDAAGADVLLVSVTAAPAEGRANDALLRLLADEWRVARRDLTIVAGLKSRDKVIHVAGDPIALMRRLSDAIAALPTR